ncbi:IS4 family transposase [Microbulbifer spongiae]|uniref:IS4 family transposase n=1 Tax=Microbulbifer spongiae TaxID=2944933 RepID=A0ABY9EE52_9GAMM|nr:IS4 family transposase [Microbulbifer sp. MI-G]WKD50537.1 IS4 family transposase [Microbulbifer sp. MI-G]
MAITAYGSGALLDMAYAPFQGKGTGEHSLLRSMLDNFSEGDIVVADRYYTFYFLIAELQSRGVDIVMQQHATRRTDFCKGQRLDSRDHLVEWRKPAKPKWMERDYYEQFPDKLPARELQAGKKVLVTTLLSNKAAPRKQLSNLYNNRWQVELNLREIKTTLGMDILRCKTPEMVVKEIWVYLLTYKSYSLANESISSTKRYTP